MHAGADHVFGAIGKGITTISKHPGRLRTQRRNVALILAALSIFTPPLGSLKPIGQSLHQFFTLTPDEARNRELQKYWFDQCITLGDPGSKAAAMLTFLWVIIQTLPVFRENRKDVAHFISSVVNFGLEDTTNPHLQAMRITDFDRPIYELTDLFRTCPLPPFIMNELAMMDRSQYLETNGLYSSLPNSYKAHFPHAEQELQIRMHLLEVTDYSLFLMTRQEKVVIVPTTIEHAKVIIYAVKKLHIGHLVETQEDLSTEAIWSVYLGQGAKRALRIGSDNAQTSQSGAGTGSAEPEPGSQVDTIAEGSRLNVYLDDLRLKDDEEISSSTGDV